MTKVISNFRNSNKFYQKKQAGGLIVLLLLVYWISWLQNKQKTDTFKKSILKIEVGTEKHNMLVKNYIG